MHDPWTLITSIRIPFTNIHFADIWHVDPETNGTEDSCGWAFTHLQKSEEEFATKLITNIHDNISDWFDVSDDECIYRIKHVFRLYKAFVRPWYKHPRWHVWHWRVRIIPLQNLKRYLFSRCCICGGRFEWGELPISTQWNSDGPKWFVNEVGVSHERCFYRRIQ